MIHRAILLGGAIRGILAKEVLIPIMNHVNIRVKEAWVSIGFAIHASDIGPGIWSTILGEFAVEDDAGFLGRGMLEEEGLEGLLGVDVDGVLDVAPGVFEVEAAVDDDDLLKVVGVLAVNHLSALLLKIG